LGQEGTEASVNYIALGSVDVQEGQEELKETDSEALED